MQDMKLHVEDVSISPSSIQRVEAQQIELDGKIGEVTIGQVHGKITLRSRLENGKLSVEFSPHFDYGIDISLMENDDKERYVQRLRDLGLSQEHIYHVVKLVETENGVKVGRLEALGDLPGWTAKNDDAQAAVPPTVGPRANFTLPLPNIPVNLDPQIDVRNISISNIGFRDKTDVSSDTIDLAGFGIDNFDVKSQMPDPVQLESAEIRKLTVQPSQVPSFAFSNLKTRIDVQRIGSEEIPLEIDSEKGQADISLTLLDWHPRWRVTICFYVLWKRVCVWIEFGINLRITLFYRWAIQLLKVAVRIRDAFAKAISIQIGVKKVLLTQLKIGLLRLGKLLYEKA